MGKILFSIVGILCLCIAVLIYYISETSLENTVRASEMNAISIIEQFKVLRGYYVQNVVKKVKANSEIKITYDHKNRTDAIPLPATLIHDMSELLGKRSEEFIQLKLYSAYPFPNRRGRVLDEFGRKALAHFQENPEQTLVQRDSLANGQEVVRIAVADRMVAKACVQCHNNRPDTPKNDWRLNDVRGVLEVISPIDTQISFNQAMLKNVIWIALFAVVLVGFLVAGIWMFMRSMVRTETESAKIVSMMENTSTGTMFADKGFIIRYMNAEFVKNLRNLEAHLPVSADNVLGQSIDIFHRQSEHQRRLLSNPDNLPMVSRITIGREIIDITIARFTTRTRTIWGR
jgi:methyl-accepting chemotaxis protein